MYLPKQFQADEKTALNIMKEYPFATLLGIYDGEFSINHFPILVNRENPISLVGHMSRKNPQCSQLKEGSMVTLIFQGPNSYITPSWYSEDDVPTWNYVVVHAKGTIHWVEEEASLTTILQALVKNFEDKSSKSWKFQIPNDRKTPQALSNAIIGFEVTVDSVETKLKLSQNRSKEDFAGVIRGLESRKDENSAKIREMMLGLHHV